MEQPISGACSVINFVLSVQIDQLGNIIRTAVAAVSMKSISYALRKF